MVILELIPAVLPAQECIVDRLANHETKLSQCINAVKDQSEELTNLKATVDKIKTECRFQPPVGAIISYMGETEMIDGFICPKGAPDWVLCNLPNNKKNNRIPNLENKFIVGAGETKPALTTTEIHSPPLEKEGPSDPMDSKQLQQKSDHKTDAAPMSDNRPMPANYSIHYIMRVR